MSTAPVVALIHATPASMPPVAAAFAQRFPDANLWHILDDRLDRDAAAAGGLNETLAARMDRLIQYAVDADADAVQLACSMFGPVASRASQPVPVLTSDQGAFDEVARLAPKRVLVLASLPPAAVDSTARLTASLTKVGQSPTIDSAIADDARAASLAGDHARLARSLVDAVGTVEPVDVVMLAQYSLSPVAAAVSEQLGVPVLSGPHLAASKLARELAGKPA
ncbi:hypothetical protein [Nocardioides sp. CER19]|uniref:hypothetical protein n=1 Tax=Nocardioides sp. CER19 TaxID=3038538 RepID=UPI00244A07A4|nr:hypothetical protein [Nocardioides sp. CER19]MDH2416098.1 hypothetical protein [Nocardioides sp. CER19]